MMTAMIHVLIVLLTPSPALGKKGTGPGYYHYITDDESKEFLERGIRDKKRWYYDFLEIQDLLERASSFASSNEFFDWWMNASNEDIMEFIQEIEDLDMVESLWLKAFLEGA